MIKLFLLFCLLTTAKLESESWKTVPEEIDPKYWENLAREEIKKSCKLFPSLKTQKRAKNVILFLGDGMGLPTIAASRFYIAQKRNLNGSAFKHPFESFPFNTFARTYDLETMVTDSASSANAYLTGSKTRTGMIGVTGNLTYQQCGVWPEDAYTHSVLEAAYKAKKATGILTTTRITHASPSGCFGHVTFRDFESDETIHKICGDMSEQMHCQDLACQLVNLNKDVTVAIGGGRANFFPKGAPVSRSSDQKGNRLDGRNLVEEWIADKKAKKLSFQYLDNPKNFSKLDIAKTDVLLGLPYDDHMPFSGERNMNEPSLMEYTQLAINILKKNNNGFFLFVEGGRIDHAHHSNLGRHAMEEMSEFDNAIEAAVNMVDLSETMIIVTADHSHTFEFIGQSSRFRDVLDIDNGYSEQTIDNKSLTMLTYMNGPAGLINKTRSDPSEEDTKSYAYMQQALVPLPYSSHGGDDVGVYATGPFSNLFHKTVENTFISQAMKFALGVEPYIEDNVCD